MERTEVKIHRPLVSAVIEALQAIFITHRKADDVVREMLTSHSQWGSRDRRWVAEMVYDVVRWWRLYCFVGGYDYQLPAEVNWNDLLAIALQHKKVKVKNPDMLPATWENEATWAAQLKKRKPLEVETSFPDWLHTLAKKELSKKWPETARALNDPADVFLRCNTLKTGREELLNELIKAGIPAEADDRGADAIRLLQRTNLQAHPLYRSGYFEVQDIASQQVAYVCNPRKGRLIADVCAGAGGKSLHLAALAKNEADILASDISPDRLKILDYRARQAGVKNLKLCSPEGLAHYDGQCDTVLLDVPCSGSGVIRRQPDTKWRLTPEKLASYIKTQRELLEQYHSLVKPGGKLVYVTCSILASENEAQVKWFLSKYPSFLLKSEKRYWPQDGYDGFYLAEMMLG